MKHTEENDNVDHKSPTPTPHVPDTPLPQGDEIVFLRQAQTLCDALRDLADDKDRLTERIERLKDARQTSGESELEATVSELEYHFKLYGANCHPLEVATADVTSAVQTTANVQTLSSIAKRLFVLNARAESLFKQNALMGDKLGMKRDPRSFLCHSRGPLVPAN